jgi:hypothetical protein
VGEVSVEPREIEPIADDELVGDREPHVVERTGTPAGSLVEERDAEGPGCRVSSFRR